MSSLSFFCCYHITHHRVSYQSVLCQQVQYYRTTGLHTVLTTELLRSDISFGWVLFQKDTTLVPLEMEEWTLLQRPLSEEMTMKSLQGAAEDCLGVALVCLKSFGEQVREQESMVRD